MGFLKDCKIKIKNFKKKLKKSVDKEAKQPYNKTRSAEGTEKLKRNREQGRNSEGTTDLEN